MKPVFIRRPNPVCISDLEGLVERRVPRTILDHATPCGTKCDVSKTMKIRLFFCSLLIHPRRPAVRLLRLRSREASGDTRPWDSSTYSVFRIGWRRRLACPGEVANCFWSRKKPPPLVRDSRCDC